MPTRRIRFRLHQFTTLTKLAKLIIGNITIVSRTLWAAQLSEPILKRILIFTFLCKQQHWWLLTIAGDKYKELDTWGQTLGFNPPFNLLATQSQHTSVDFVQPFITYGYLIDQKLDIGNYGGVTGGFRTDYSSAFGAG